MKDALRLGVRLGVAAMLLVLAFRLAIPSDSRSIAETLSSAWVAESRVAVGWFAAALVCFGLSFVAVARRFQVLLGAAGLGSSFSPLLRAYVVANFLALVLPSALLSDVYRVVDARRDTGRSIEVIAVAAAERVLSLAALGVVVLAAAPFAPLPPEMNLQLMAALAIAGGLVATSFAFLHPASNALLRRLARRLAGVSRALAESAESALDAISALSEKPRTLLSGFGWSIVAQLLPVAAVICLSRPLDAHIADYWYAVIVPLVTLVTLIPVSIGGAGVREWLYVELFGSLGMRAEVALSLSLSVFAATLVWGFFGLALFAWGRRSQADPSA
ncbi:MAG: flippase-like domain-containing protein [Deltaproteobacteria bacterium]|nr:flippase-like domain-containing protein [Deltaproteobacteria bacterium]MBW2360934.1 flippase-like domain-containing protein [Deltaproteobacteria bacterium]